MSYEYQLVVEFKEKQKDVLYEGPSWYTAKIVDQISIAKHRIVIRFMRAAKIDPQAYLFTKSSPVRIQLYRAACFYLAVTGALPGVKKVCLKSAQGDMELDKERLTQHWANCRIDLTMPAGVAARCFRQHGKTCYVAITYFLKAQLDSFPHDCFRAAWSGVNAIYSHLVSPEVQDEHVKLDALRNRIENSLMADSTTFVGSLPDSFWHDVNWGLFVKAGMSRRKNRIDHILDQNGYKEALIYDKLVEAFCRERKKDCPDIVAHLQKEHARRMQGRKRDPKAEMVFFVTEYCYMLRNRSFHAVRPYPIFDLFDESGNSTEALLTKLLLYVIRDLLAETI